MIQQRQPAVFHPTYQAKVIRRAEYNAKASEDTDKFWDKTLRSRYELHERRLSQCKDRRRKFADDREERATRWTQKLQYSPLGVDQLAMDQASRGVAEEERLSKTLDERRLKEAKGLIFRRSISAVDALDHLRTEKRQLMYSAKQLKAMCDVARTTERSNRHRENRREQMEALQKAHETRMASDLVLMDIDWRRRASPKQKQK
mmetsp:Transcript_4704/g.11413  ORF Transcript_4704/g.11413 Transcript_4704/m.11413 type:complete len:203 (-) Transcript_4704:5-613(-)